jgi:hypothetical protein
LSPWTNWRACQPSIGPRRPPGGNEAENKGRPRAARSRGAANDAGPTTGTVVVIAIPLYCDPRAVILRKPPTPGGGCA